MVKIGRNDRLDGLTLVTRGVGGVFCNLERCQDHRAWLSLSPKRLGIHADSPMTSLFHPVWIKSGRVASSYLLCLPCTLIFTRGLKTIPKMRTRIPILANLLSLAIGAARADPTWPAATDEMEEIIFQLQGFRGRLFNDIISPCGNEAAGPGRVTASEWLRAAFQ